jgi:hypothetical protein
MVEFGLQDRDQGLEPGRSNADGSLAWAIALEARRSTMTGAVRWRGRHVHGPAMTPFLYLSLRRADGQPTEWLRRLKVPLPSHSWDAIAACTPAVGCVLEATISGHGSGTIPLLGAGWTMRPTPIGEELTPGGAACG